MSIILGIDGFYYKISKNQEKRRICVKSTDGEHFTVHPDRYIIGMDGYLYKIASTCEKNIITIIGHNNQKHIVENKDFEEQEENYEKEINENIPNTTKNLSKYCSTSSHIPCFPTVSCEGDVGSNNLDKIPSEIFLLKKNYSKHDIVIGEELFEEEEDDSKELIQESLDMRNEELISKDDDIIPEEAQTFMNKEMAKNDDSLFLSTGAERVLIEEFYNVIIQGNNVKARSDISVEGIIFKIIAEKASEKGYKSFYKKEITNALSQYGHLSNRFLEKYEFLFNHSGIFEKAERNKLLEAINSYRITKKLLPENMFDQDLLDEYRLIRSIQEAYFKEHKKYLNLNQLGTGVIGKGTYTFRQHLTQKKDANNFSPSTIFKIECWAKKKLKIYLKDVQDEISNWRRRNNDRSVYNIKDTPLKEIAYAILVLYSQVNDIAININELDEILNNVSANTFGSRFFGVRFNKVWKDSGWKPNDDKMDQLKSFVKVNFEHKAPKQTQQLIDDIDNYIKIPRKIYLRHSKRFVNLKPYQLKLLIDITKGMDTLYCDFFTSEEGVSSKIGTRVVRAHLDEDPDFEFIFYRFLDENDYSYRFKLAPLRFKSSHNDLHERNFPKGIGNNIIEARIRHLYELDKISFDKKLTTHEYYRIFREEFRNKKEYIFQFRKDVNIWNEFEFEQIHRLTDRNIEGFVKRWIESKQLSEISWYNYYYKEFYNKKYLRFMRNLEIYKKENLEDGRISPFYEWFLNEYLPNEIFP